ncbi:MAG: hypothetical protein AAGM22_17655 [Acidobacteriota bacterium]
MKPFRWDISRREQLGQLVDGEEAESYPQFLEDLRRCSARVVATAGPSDLVFVGRSPESLFDYLSGVLMPSDWSDRLKLMNVSMRFGAFNDPRVDAVQAEAGFRRHLTELGLSPQQILMGPRRVALIDLVDTGSTLQNLSGQLLSWAEEEETDVPGVLRKIHFVGVTVRQRTSPHTFRWQQHAPWLEPYGSGAARNVSAPGHFWRYLGNTQAKVSETNPPWRWHDASVKQPPRGATHLAALRLALRLFDAGSDPAERRRFTEELSRQRAFRYPWCRKLISQLRGVAV